MWGESRENMKEKYILVHKNDWCIKDANSGKTVYRVRFHSRALEIVGKLNKGELTVPKLCHDICYP